MTLGMLGVAFGLAQWITAAAPQPILNDTDNLIFGAGNLGPIPGLLIWMALAALVGAVVLAKTSLGRQVLATGGSRMAAEFTGINTNGSSSKVLLVVVDGGEPRGHALRGPLVVRPLPVGFRRRAVGHRGGDSRRESACSAATPR